MTMPRSTRVVGCPTPARPRTSGPARRSSRPPPRVTSKARSPCPTLRCWTRTPPSAPRPWCRPCRICHRFRFREHLNAILCYADDWSSEPSGVSSYECRLRLPLGRSFSYRSHTGTRPNDLWKGERSTLAWYQHGTVKLHKGQWQCGEGRSVLGFALLVKRPHCYSAVESEMQLQRLKIQQKKVLLLMKNVWIIHLSDAIPIRSSSTLSSSGASGQI
ncbi:uncharacterized protein LOC119316698 isoform X2 [Triticum dicoccoides]|uniref:uncharacterized protein LOC119316698 isoform X2 n=1 Tax=Triticum dicoccoides TaxID=85692 RepID=UPI00189151E2|nr:uncharacterized protein LOC119316698 isoform X2 [Triticum dicoccoides]